MTKQQNETPLYATLFYHIRQQLDLNWNEYIYLDMVYHLSKDGWCYKTIDNTAADLGMGKNGIIKMRDRLLKRGLLKKNIKGHVKTTVMYHSVVRTPSQPYHSVTKRTTQGYSAVPLSGTKNNNEINNRNRAVDLKAQNPTSTDPVEHEKARAASDNVRRLLADKFGLKVKPHA